MKRKRTFVLFQLEKVIFNIDLPHMETDGWGYGMVSAGTHAHTCMHNTVPPPVQELLLIL